MPRKLSQPNTQPPTTEAPPEPGAEPFDAPGTRRTALEPGDEALAAAIREALAPDEARLSQDAGRAFSRVHARLMESIDCSRQDQEPEPPAMGPASTWRTCAAGPVPIHQAMQPDARRPWRAPGDADACLEHLEAVLPLRDAGRGAGKGRQVLAGTWGRRARAAARYGVAACLLSAAVVGGHAVGRQSGPQALPVRSLVEDYTSALGPGAPLEVSARSEDDTSRWMSARLGHRVSLPQARRVGATLLGARRCTVQGRHAAQAHYLKDGVRVALYQIHAPHLGLSELGEVKSGGRSYFTQQVGNCSLIAWRADEDIMAVVSPLEMPASLSLALSMREATPVLSALDTRGHESDG